MLVRADGSTAIGIGHLMRTLALLEAWRSKGGAVMLLGQVPGVIRDRLTEAGTEVMALAAEPGTPEDARETSATLEKLVDASGGDPWLVLDGYHFGDHYRLRLRDRGCRILALDDHHHLKTYAPDVLLNQNLHGLGTPYQAVPEAVLLLGPRFALLREEFARRSARRRTHPERAQRLLLVLGGGDPGNVTARVLKGLVEGVRELKPAIRVIVGPANPHRADLEQIEQAHTAFVTLVDGARDMAGHMEWADLIVSAAGSTCWESAALGLPQLLVITADNQREVGRSLGEAGAAIVFGNEESVSCSHIADTVLEVALQRDVRQSLGRRGRELVDGQGAERVASALIELSTGSATRPALRAATWDDRVSLWHLANDPVVRRNAFRPDPIPFESHLDWLRVRLAHREKRIYICEIGPVFAGQVRYEVDGRSAEVSFAVAPAFRGRGLGTYLLRASVGKACGALSVDRLIGRVKERNIPSRRAFTAAGWRETETRDGVVEFRHSCDGANR